MNIVIVDADKDLISIDGYEFCGWVIEEEACVACGQPVIYTESLDAKFCATCNAWKEPPCSDPECTFCRQRLKPPLPAKQ